MAKNFDQLLDETVTTTLGHVLGNEPANALIYHMGVKASVSGAKEFAGALERVTGSGSVIVEKLIVRALYNKIGIRLEDSLEGFSFENSISRAQKLMVQGGDAH
jgi:hypothetical protein